MTAVGVQIPPVGGGTISDPECVIASVREELVVAETRRLAAVAFADVAGWSRLIEKSDVETLRAWKALRSDVIEPLTREHGGRLLEIAGDPQRAVIFSSHIVSDLERVANRIWIVKDGRLLWDGDTDELKQSVQRLHIRARPGRGVAVRAVL